MQIRHANFGWLHSPPLPPASCHCLIVQSAAGIVLIDTGIGLQDIADPESRIGRENIAAAGFLFLPAVTAVRQLETLGVSPSAVTDIVLTHCDHDHVGGLSDFPDAHVHLSAEEKQNLDSGNPRFSAAQFAHGPRWVVWERNDCDTLGLPSRRVQTQLDVDIRLVPLFGHTHGHCGVAIRDGDAWILHAGDAYYLRGELTDENHPIGELATLRAEDNDRRLESLGRLRQLARRTDVNLTMCGYHDITELPDDIPTLDEVCTDAA